ncbi:MAG: CDP-alcohol phosphatidyltransferase family protein [Patescibacteria group bacterium]|jgi:phosphatidylglycerophosphate synthase
MEIPNHQADPTKHKTPILWYFEQRWIAAVVPHLPDFLNGKNLTMATALWTALMIIIAIVWRDHISTLWVVNALIIFQYFTDCMDGAIGRYRKSGLIRWGHFMDHLLDFIFLCAIMIAYFYLLPEFSYYFLAILAIIGSLMVTTYLMAGISGKFRMGYFRIGLTEIRLIVIIMNILVACIGTGLLKYLLPIFTGSLFLVLCYAIFRGQQEAERLDKNLDNNDHKADNENEDRKNI